MRWYVITSYSIHYTKLYESDTRRFCRDAGCGQRRRLNTHILVTSALIPIPNYFTAENTIMEKSFAERVAEAKAAVPAITPQAAKERKERDPNTFV